VELCVVNCCAVRVERLLDWFEPTWPSSPMESIGPSSSTPASLRSPPAAGGIDPSARHHFSHTWLERGGPEGDLMDLNGWSSPAMLARYGVSDRARRTYDRIMTDNP
jgi:hypothetical protein